MLFVQLMKEKAEKFKKIAEDKAKSIELSGVRNVIEKSKSTIVDSDQKVSEAAVKTSVKAKTVVSNSADRVSQATSDTGVKTKSVVENSTQKATALAGEVAAIAKSVIVSGKESAGEIIEKYGPTLEKVVVNGMVGIADEKLRDEKFLRASLERIHDLLPIFVRLIVSRDMFVNFCLARKEPLILKISGYKEKTVNGDSVKNDT